jgi:hypothetical protein
MQPSPRRVRLEDHRQLAAEIGVPQVRRRRHVVVALPDFVEAVLTQGTTPSDDRLELRWARPEHDRLHDARILEPCCAYAEGSGSRHLPRLCEIHGFLVGRGWATEDEAFEVCTNGAC